MTVQPEAKSPSSHIQSLVQLETTVPSSYMDVILDRFHIDCELVGTRIWQVSMQESISAFIFYGDLEFLVYASISC